MDLSALSTRGFGAGFVACMAVASLFLARSAARRIRRPAIVWGGAAYWFLLHLVCLAGLLTSAQFESALAPLMLLTFPFSILTANNHYLPGFATLPDLARNYMRYIVCFGGLNALGVSGFLSLAIPSQSVRRPSP